MGRSWRLENFDLRPPEPDLPEPEGAGVPPAALEEAKLEAFDQGVKAGWEDAMNAYRDDQLRISAEFAHNLQAMSFTYHEARTATLRDTEVLFRGMIEAVLPQMIKRALTPLLMERITAAVQELSEPVIEITVAPESVERLEKMAEEAVAPPLSILGEPSLKEGQAFLKFGDAEEQIDLNAVLQEMVALVDDLFAPETLDQSEITRNAG